MKSSGGRANGCAGGRADVARIGSICGRIIEMQMATTISSRVRNSHQLSSMYVTAGEGHLVKQIEGGLAVQQRI